MEAIVAIIVGIVCRIFIIVDSKKMEYERRLVSDNFYINIVGLLLNIINIKFFTYQAVINNNTQNSNFSKTSSQQVYIPKPVHIL